MDSETSEDFLEVDQKIPGQNYVCLSFISPENIIKEKEKFFLVNFIKDVIKAEEPNNVSNLDKSEVTYDTIDNIYGDWLSAQKERLENEYYEQNNFQTTMRGIKIRGIYDTLKEAQIRAQVLQRRDKAFSVFVGQVGFWLPWDPSADQIQNEQYQESGLNDLMQKYKENIDTRDEVYHSIKESKIKEAKEEAARKKKEQDIESNNDDPENPSSLSKSSPVDTNEDREKNIIKLREICNEKEKTVSNAKANVEDSTIVKELDAEDPWMQRKFDETKNEVLKEIAGENSIDDSAIDIQ